MSGVRITWAAREPPLAPVAAVARGPVAARLAARLLAMPHPALAALTAVMGPDLLVVLGPREALPWCDGVGYLGRDPDAPTLLVPTALAPSVHAALVERALLGRFPAASAPLAVLLGPDQVIELGDAQPLAAERLRARRGAA